MTKKSFFFMSKNEIVDVAGGANPTILRHERVLRRVEIDKPVPVRPNPKQNRGAMDGGGQGRASVRVGEIRLPHDVHIPCGSEGRDRPDG